MARTLFLALACLLLFSRIVHAEDAPINAEIVLVGGTIFDGSGAEGVVGDVAIADKKIVAVGKFQHGKILRKIDCTGLVIAPGFIDVHNHSDGPIVAPATRGNVNFLTQGCTTIVTGNCGSGPIRVKEFYDKVDAAGSGTHVAHLLPQGSLRESVMQHDNRKPTEEELAKMRDIAAKAMEEGAWGMSTGLIYIPGTFCETEELIEIVKKVTSADGYERIKKQTEYDDGGLGAYSIALFGTPGSGKCEWELTGRHLTLRADGNSVDKAAFGGPIIYGHGEEDPKQNLYHYQTKQANEVFKALDPKQAEKALIEKAPSEGRVPLQGEKGHFPGVAVSELSADQKKLVEETLKVILSPYRTEDVEEVMEILKSTGGVDKLHMAFYQEEDLNSDKLHMAFYQEEDLNSDKQWDIWRVEGPSMVWHFRGAPHVHAYINIGLKA